MNEAMKYMTVKEAAAAAGTSTQYIYKILDKQLKPYKKKIDKKIYIETTAIDLIKKDGLQPSLQPLEYSKNGGLQPTNATDATNQTEKKLQTELQENTEIALLKQLVEGLQLDKKELQKDKEQLIKDKEYLKQEALKWQQLFADERKKVIMLEQKEEQEPQEVEFEAAADEKQEQEQPTEQEQNEQQELPQGFINKLKWLLKS